MLLAGASLLALFVIALAIYGSYRFAVPLVRYLGEAGSTTEYAICRSYPLGQADARMAALFGVVTSLVAVGQRGDIGDAQRRWSKERSACGDDSACIARAHQSHITALSSALDAIANRVVRSESNRP
jgi:uncharacterized protein